MPKRIEWQTCYEVGNERIDREHRIFLSLIAQLAEDVDRGRDHARIARTFSEIVKYGEFHFLSEENLMIDSGYPDYLAHKALHECLMASLRIRADSDDPRSLIEFVVDWFAKHTVGEDIRIGNHLAVQPPGA